MDLQPCLIQIPWVLLHPSGWAQPGFGPADSSEISEHVHVGAAITSSLSVLCSVYSAILFLKGSESAHSPTGLFNKNYFSSQLQAAKKINLNFPSSIFVNVHCCNSLRCILAYPEHGSVRTLVM